jgi:hypothetical protein
MKTTHPPVKSILSSTGIAVFTDISAMAQTPTTGQLQKALIDARAEVEWPERTFEEAAKNLGTAEQSLAIVRDGVSIADYTGSFHGTDGTLRTWESNNQDQAILLQTMLLAQGYASPYLPLTRYSRQPHSKNKSLAVKRP